MTDSRSSAEDWSSCSSFSLGGNSVESGTGREVESTFMLGTFRFILDFDDLSLIRTQLGISSKFDLKLPGLSDRVYAPSLGQLRLYEKMLRTGLRLPLHPFIIEFFQVLNMSRAPFS